MIIKPDTLFVGKPFLHFPFLDSTNRYALELLSQSQPVEGAVVSTYEQRSGIGQQGSIWESEPQQNISLSAILYPRFLEVRRQFLLSQAMSLAVRDFAAGLLPEGGIRILVKWPNDLYLGTKKAAGMLIQNQLSGSSLQASVVGIGININQIQFSTHVPNATSFRLETGQSYDLNTLVANLCQCIERRYLQLRSGQFAQIEQDYRTYLYRHLEEALFKRANGNVFSGKIVGLNPEGRLLIDHSGGTEAFEVKEITFL